MSNERTEGGRRVLLGVTGGIAAYKAAELARLLVKGGDAVQVVMTRAATEFIAPLTFQALTHRPVRTELFDATAEAGMGHLELARWADLVVVAPASADFIARLAHGRADDLLSTLCLATEAPIWLAPAMNVRMWRNHATRDNVALLKERGMDILGPAIGPLAEGESGEGRLLEPAAIAEALAVPDGPLKGARLLISAGPTREALDPVRYITNRSSGRMGFAVAEAAARAGARVTLVAGPVTLSTPPGCERVAVESAADMHREVLARAADSDIYIGVAAIADFRPRRSQASKIKKGEQTPALELERTADVLADVAAMTNAPFTVGFAAETGDVEANARTKMQAKGLDMIAANHVGGDETGFDDRDNALTVLWPGGRHELPRAAKPELARSLLALIAERFAQCPRAAAVGQTDR